MRLETWNPHKSSQITRLERIQHYAARFVANDHRRTTSPITLVLTLNWQTLERRRIIKQAMTFYKILNNTIKISPPTGLLTRSHNRRHCIAPRSRLNPSQTDMIIMDFSKAFDKVPHRRLQYKLDWYGIRGSTHNWIQHFLQGRSQRVVSEGSQSSPILSSLVCPKVLFLARYYF